MADHGRAAHWLMGSLWTGNWSHRVRIARRGLHRTARASWPPIHIRRRAHVEERRIRGRDHLSNAVSWSRYRQRRTLPQRVGPLRDSTRRYSIEITVADE